MGKVISLIGITADGFADAQFLMVDDEFHEFAHGLLSNSQAVAFGRSTFELFQNIWPPRLENANATERQRKLARALTDIPKTVYSSTLNATTWSNSAIVKEIDAGNFNAYKQEGKKGLFIVGSVSIVEVLTKMKQIDEYYFCIQPIIAGSGSVRLFDKLNMDTPLLLKYVDSKQLKSGVHIIHYNSVH